MEDGVERDLCFPVWPFPVGGGGGAYSFVACCSHLTVDLAPLSRRKGREGGGRKHITNYTSKTK